MVILPSLLNGHYCASPPCAASPPLLVVATSLLSTSSDGATPRGESPTEPHWEVFYLLQISSCYDIRYCHDTVVQRVCDCVAATVRIRCQCGPTHASRRCSIPQETG